MYDHAIATLAISESARSAATPGRDRQHWPPLNSSSTPRTKAAAAGADGAGQPGDSSVFGWEVMALHMPNCWASKSQPIRRLARRYIDNACTNGVTAGYQPGVDPTQTMTAEMLFARVSLGERLSGGAVRDATAFLAEYPPDGGAPDLYCRYYSSLAMLQMNSPAWSDWNTRTRDALIRLQTRGGFADGCWQVTAKGIDRSGYIFTTSIATLTLEVYYRYAPGLAEAPGQ